MSFATKYALNSKHRSCLVKLPLAGGVVPRGIASLERTPGLIPRNHIRRISIWKSTSITRSVTMQPQFVDLEPPTLIAQRRYIHHLLSLIYYSSLGWTNFRGSLSIVHQNLVISEQIVKDLSNSLQKLSGNRLVFDESNSG